mgnify:CR=1 FL=1
MWLELFFPTNLELAPFWAGLILTLRSFIFRSFADPKFTAPITGRYQFNVNIYLENIPNDLAYFTIRLVTSNREYYSIFDPGVGSAATSYHSLHISALADMDASDTAFVNCYTPSGTNNTDVAGSHVTSFSGYLVA